MHSYVIICSIMVMTTTASSVSLHPSIMSWSTSTLSSIVSPALKAPPSTNIEVSQPIVSLNLLPRSPQVREQPSVGSITTSRDPAATNRPSPAPQPPAQRQQPGVQAMTFGGAIYTTVLASLGMANISFSCYTTLYLTSYSCFQSSWYGCCNTFKTCIV